MAEGGRFNPGWDPRRGRGKAGRSGRPSLEFRAWCKELFEVDRLAPDSWPEGRRKLWERAQKSDRVLVDLLSRAYGPSGVPSPDDGDDRLVVDFVYDWRAPDNGQQAVVERREYVGEGRQVRERTQQPVLDSGNEEAPAGGQLVERVVRPIASVIDEYPDGRKETRNVGWVVSERPLSPGTESPVQRRMRKLLASDPPADKDGGA